MLGLALLPTVSHALAAAGGGDPWAEICSAAGARGQPAAAQPDPAGAPVPAAASHLDHCPLCSVASHVPALPPAEVAMPGSPDGADFIAALFAHATHRPFAWGPAQPRGPPAVS